MISKENARQLLSKALKTGEIAKPDPPVCEICGDDVSERETQAWHTGVRHKKLVGHHYNGYGNYLAVWWVCYKCNRRLPKHDGSQTLEDAKKSIRFHYSISKEKRTEMYEAQIEDSENLIMICQSNISYLRNKIEKLR